MDQAAVFNLEPHFAPIQSLVKILPYHKGKTEKKNRFSPMALKKFLYSVQIQAHITV